MKVFKTPNTGGTHSQSVWDEKKTACGSVIRTDWAEGEGELSDITCAFCIKKIFGRKRKFTPARKFS